MGLMEECIDVFNIAFDDLYAVLDGKKEDTAAQLKRCYRRKALQCHPDKVGSDSSEKAREAFTKKFQALSKVHAVLSDVEARKLYDETGLIEGDDREPSDKDPDMSWEKYFDKKFKKVTPDDIERDKKQYQGSREEKQHIAKYYVKCEGDMEMMLEYVLHSSLCDIERFSVLIDKIVANGSVENYPKYQVTLAEMRAKYVKEREREETEKSKKRKVSPTGLSEEDGMGALMAKIQSRQESREPFGGVLQRYATEADLENDPLQDVVFNYGRKKSRKKGKGKPKKTDAAAATL